MTGQNRKRAEFLGRFAEIFAILVLSLKGYRILQRRCKTPLGEIDLLCLRGKIVCVVEVKFRPDIDTGLTTVSDANWKRIARAADLLLAQSFTDLFYADRRFDLFVLTPSWQFRHIRDVWRPETALTRG